MRKLLLLLLTCVLLVSCGGDEPNPCLMSKDFIKQDLTFPDEAEMSAFDCSSETNSDGSYTILRKVKAQNAFGVESSYVYKVRLRFNGGITTDINNWELIGIISEEYRQ